MTRLLSHADQVIANNQLAQHLEILHVAFVLGHVSRQWFITLLFYESVHWVEDQLQQKKYPPSFDHRTRKKRLRQVWFSHKTAIRAYLLLEHFSRQARYDGWIPTDQDLLDAQAYLQHVKTFII
ncbi:hypothetical protein [Sulfobacillus thermosulfidooxidans]|uniref:hypothetical protein n=1 Tax=Sulfobacillus thermosulfidooxidans TaxID=28034 RepID=UPI0002FAE27B|nr:hypothetical protein [Sulfobacillus thermosulfidooxidans]